MVEAKLK